MPFFSNNKFRRVSITGIFIFNGNKSTIERNQILFSGNNSVGDGIDLINSEDILLSQNYIASGSCYSVVIIRGKNITLRENIISGGITYAIFISGTGLGLDRSSGIFYLAKDFNEGSAALNANKNISIINNYLSQNRYGLTGSNISGFHVKGNVFIQKFLNDADRRFWTNNEVLLKNVVNVHWAQNWYKEAYAQDDFNHEIKSSRLEEFPLSGGVHL